MNPLHFAAPLDLSIFLLNSYLKLVGTPGITKVVLNAFLYNVLNSQAAPFFAAPLTLNRKNSIFLFHL